MPQGESGNEGSMTPLWTKASSARRTRCEIAMMKDLAAGSASNKDEMESDEKMQRKDRSWMKRKKQEAQAMFLTEGPWGRIMGNGQ